MPQFDPNQKIASVLKEIHAGSFRIPNIQRGYEWDSQRVLKLLDSIMNGYPIGAIMIWQPAGGEYAVACPQNWLVLGSDKKFHQKLLKEQRWLAVVRFGEGALESSAAAGAFATNLIFANHKPTADDVSFGLNASALKGAFKNAELLCRAAVTRELDGVLDGRQEDTIETRQPISPRGGQQHSCQT